MKTFNLPADEKALKSLNCGEIIYLNGILYTARDAAHKRIEYMLKRGETLPFELENAAIYYAGPCPAAPGTVTGSCGPTTSSRVDTYTPQLLDKGLKVMIGKGGRNRSVIESIIKNGAVYLAAIGGCGALYAAAVKECEVIAFPELLSEAVHKFRVENFPVAVAIDCRGNSIFSKNI